MSASMKKIAVAAVLALAAWFGSGALGFPHVFQAMFVAYVALGLVVFLLLDAPPMPRLVGVDRRCGAAWVLSRAVRDVYRGGVVLAPI